MRRLHHLHFRESESEGMKASAVAEHSLEDVDFTARHHLQFTLPSNVSSLTIPPRACASKSVSEEEYQIQL